MKADEIAELFKRLVGHMSFYPVSNHQSYAVGSVHFISRYNKLYHLDLFWHDYCYGNYKRCSTPLEV